MRMLIVLLFLCGAAVAAPGAHGPGGEHLDAPSVAGGKGTVPRFEASTELFELVGRLSGGELSVLIDRFETNEPVLGAQVELQFGAVKAVAKFHADHGDYAFDDATLLKALAMPGEHALIFSVVAGQASDLLEGKLIVASAGPDGHPDDHGHWLERTLIAAGVVVLAALAFFGWRHRRRRLAHAAVLLAVCAVAASGPEAAPGAHGPGGEHLDAASTSASALARLPDGSVSVPKSAQRRLEIRTLLAPASDAAATLEFPGRVVMDPNAGGRVQSAYGGRLESAGAGLPISGQKVSKGQVLAYVRHNPEPFAQANQQSQLAELRAGRAVAEQKVKRLESLEGTVPRKEIEAARIELQGLIERERRIGGSIGSREALVAPASGVIAIANAVAGQVVEARDVLFEVVDPARILVEGVLSDFAQAEKVASGTLQGQPGITLRVLGIGRSLRDGVLPITFRAEAGKGAGPIGLAINQPVTIIAMLRERVKGIVLPAQAIVRSPANEPMVWIKAGAERFVPQPVQVRPLDSATVVVIQGLAPDNRVVVRGAGLISQIR